MAYEISAGILDAETYTPAIAKAWKALCSFVEPNGKLGYVQPIGADHKEVTRDMTEVYVVGVFLAAR